MRNNFYFRCDTEKHYNYEQHLPQWRYVHVHITHHNLLRFAWIKNIVSFCMFKQTWVCISGTRRYQSGKKGQECNISSEVSNTWLCWGCDPDHMWPPASLKTSCTVLGSITCILCSAKLRVKSYFPAVQIHTARTHILNLKTVF